MLDTVVKFGMGKSNHYWIAYFPYNSEEQNKQLQEYMAQHKELGNLLKIKSRTDNYMSSFIPKDSKAIYAIEFYSGYMFPNDIKATYIGTMPLNPIRFNLTNSKQEICVNNYDKAKHHTPLTACYSLPTL